VFLPVNTGRILLAPQAALAAQINGALDRNRSALTNLSDHFSAAGAGLPRISVRWNRISDTSQSQSSNSSWINGQSSKTTVDA
jgi:hypothetical protein